MTTTREGLPPLPKRMTHLPLDPRGYPIPWFVETLKDGTRDFRVASQRKAYLAEEHGLCWVCGERRGVFTTFVIGPMCAVNRTTAEPGCHAECAEFSALACPFLTLPRAKRNEKALPEGYQEPAGGFIKRNPGVTCLWTTTSWKLWEVGGGRLYRLGAPERVLWFAEKGPATREQVLAAIDSGMPILRAEAAKEGKAATAQLEEAYQKMLQLLPAEAA